MLGFEPLSDHIGVRVTGLDPTRPIAAADADTLREALRRHRLLLLRQGPIVEADHVRLMAALGNVIVEASGRGAVSYVTAGPDGYVAGATRILFHSDGQFTDFGALQAISLYATAMERDEPTIFADMVAATRRLPAELRARVAERDIMQCVDLSLYYETGRYRLSAKSPLTPEEQFGRSIHPMLGKHRDTGEEMLNVSELFTSHVVGMDDEESDRLFDMLARYQYDPEYLYCHHWQLDDLVIWDNLALQHSRDALDAPSGRTLRRVSINPYDNAAMQAGLRAAPAAVPGFGEGW